MKSKDRRVLENLEYKKEVKTFILSLKNYVKDTFLGLGFLDEVFSLNSSATFISFNITFCFFLFNFLINIHILLPHWSFFMFFFYI